MNTIPKSQEQRPLAGTRHLSKPGTEHDIHWLWKWAGVAGVVAVYAAAMAAFLLLLLCLLSLGQRAGENGGRPASPSPLDLTAGTLETRHK